MESSNSAESNSSNPISQGCGSNNNINVQISPTTGGDFAITIDSTTTVENLKKIVSKKLKVPRDRICLLFREKQLQDGNLQLNGVTDGSKITLLPNVETGLIAQKPEIGIMQALESLNDTQVNDFLCGKAPLNLTMRLGDHMMLIQLQLSTVQISRYSQTTQQRSPSPNLSANQATNTTTNNTTSNISSNSNSSNNISTSINSSSSSSSNQCPCRPPSLMQASRNLQHTLRRLSADVLSGNFPSGREEWSSSSTGDPRRGSIYSGTFSGALNPALQDTKGRPRRDVATIVHILNDLLCSAPAAELRRVSRRGHTSATVSVPSIAGDLSSSIKRDEDRDVTSKSISCDSVVAGPSSKSANSSLNDWTALDDCDNIDHQNNRTRGKLEQLRLVMGERRERRKQRKQKVQPYTIPIQNVSQLVTTQVETNPVSDTVSA